MLMMRPPSGMWATDSCVVVTTPCTLTAHWYATSSGESVPIGPARKTAALLTKMSMCRKYSAFSHHAHHVLALRLIRVEGHGPHP
jgi:hypothetical protein